MRRSSRRAAGALLVLALAGCGLPFEPGVQEPGPATGEQARRPPTVRLPPGPQPGDDPAAILEGFVRAQVSADDDHAVAREFLTSEFAPLWEDDGEVLVFTEGTDVAVTSETGEAALSFEQQGRLRPDGSAETFTVPRDTTLPGYRVVQLPTGEWRLAAAPPGLTLSADERARSFTAYDTYFLAPAPAPDADADTGTGARHLAADRVFVPIGAEPAEALVGQVLDGPSAALVGPTGESVTSAVPPGTALVSPVTTDGAGLVTVDLDLPAEAVPVPEQIAAQLVWTLRQDEGFGALALLARGVPLAVAGSTDPLPRTALQDYDPDGLGPLPSAYALVDGRLRRLPDGPGALPPLDPRSAESVLEAAVSPRGGQVALLTVGGSDGQRTLRLGTPTRVSDVGPLTSGVFGLRSPTWGSGEVGLWMLRTTAAEEQIVLARGQQVDVVGVDGGLPSFGETPVLRVSRDGVRVALATPSGLTLWRVVPGPVPRLVDRVVLPGAYRDVSWRSSTSVVALRQTAEGVVEPRDLAIDGTADDPAFLPGLQGQLFSVTAAGDAPLLLGVVLEAEAEAGVEAERAPRLYRESGDVFEEVLDGTAPLPASAPVYPG